MGSGGVSQYLYGPGFDDHRGNRSGGLVARRSCARLGTRRREGITWSAERRTNAGEVIWRMNTAWLSLSAAIVVVNDELVRRVVAQTLLRLCLHMWHSK
jgi:hypothetical protein